MSVTFTNNSYVGGVFEEFLVRAISENKTLQDGHAHLVSGINKKLFLPRLRVSGNILQNFTNGTPSASGDVALTERTLTPNKNMLYTTFIPNDFRDYWDFSQPPSSVSLVYTELPQAFRTAMETELVRESNFDIAQSLWAGDIVTSPSPAYPLDRFNGWLYRASQDADVIDISGATTLTSSNIEDKLEEVYQLIPDAILMKETLKMFVSIKTGKLVQAAANAISGKGPIFLQTNGLGEISYNGVKIVPLAEIPNDVIFATHSGTGTDSNLWAGVTNSAEDIEPFRIDRVANNSETWFIKAGVAMDTAIINGDECVFYDGRA